MQLDKAASNSNNIEIEQTSFFGKTFQNQTNHRSEDEEEKIKI